MLFPLWGIEEGSSWAASVHEANPGDAFFADNLTAAREAIGHNPYGDWSRTFLVDRDDARVYSTRDDAAGYRVFVFYRVHRERHVCELGWVMLEPLEEE